MPGQSVRRAPTGGRPGSIFAADPELGDATADPAADPNHLLRGEFACPRCANDVLEAVSDGTQTSFLCHRCWTCWHIELGYMAPVPVPTCPGCPYKEECVRRRHEGVAQPS